MRKIYYIYTHTRLDTNEVFYVGFSNKFSESKSYGRAHVFSKQKRNSLWWKIYLKCHKNIKVDIVFETFNKEEALLKEIELISKFGKICDKQGGTLANIGDGGDHNCKPARKVIEYNKNGEFVKIWDSVPQLSAAISISEKRIYSAIKKSSLCNHKYLFRWYSDDFLKNIPPYVDTRPVPVDCYNVKDNSFVKTFKSITEASRTLNIDMHSIINTVNGKRKSAGGYYWVKHGKTFKPPQPKIVIKQFTLENKFIKTYYSYAEIQKDLNINSPTAIKNCFTGKQKQAYGYIWKLCTPRMG